MKVPFLDLKVQDNSIKRQINNVLDEVISETQFSSGRFVEKFESEFSLFCKAHYCAGVNSGTSALHLALLAHGIGPGDEVITVPNSFIATVWAISYVGAKPVFVDVDSETFLMNPKLIETKITTKTKAIIPVHLYGQPADMDSINKIANYHKLVVIEDAAQAHAARYKDKIIGSLGNTTCFSFYPGKNLGAYGEAGAVVTSDKSIYEKVKLLRNHGQIERYKHDILGYNYRMDGIQGGILSVKLKSLKEFTKGRNKISNFYDSYFNKIDELQTVKIKANNYSSRHLYVLHYKERDKLIKYLDKNGVSTGMHYPIPIHLQKAYKYLNHKENEFPNTEKNSSYCLSLPIYYGLKENQLNYIVDLIVNYFRY